MKSGHLKIVRGGQLEVALLAGHKLNSATGIGDQ